MRRLALALGLATAGAVPALPTPGTITSQDCFRASSSHVMGTTPPKASACTPTGDTVGEFTQCKSVYGMGREQARLCVTAGART